MRRPPSTALAFSTLQGQLLRRRLTGIEGVLRIELVALALLLGGYVFMKARPWFEDLSLQHGAWGVALGLEGVGLALAVLGGALVANRHARRLRAPEGPAWLALPIEAKDVTGHLAWESKLEVLWVAVPLLAVVVSAADLLAFHWHLLLAASVAGFLLMAADLGAALGNDRAARAAAPRPGLPTPLRILADVAPPSARPRLPAARWRRVPAWRALLAKDALLAARLPALRQGLGFALALAALSLLGWFLPGGPPAGVTPAIDLRGVATFFVTLGSAAVFAEWLVLLTGSDPFATLRALPIGVRAVWTARAGWAVGFAGLLLAGHGVLARGLATGPWLLFLSWVAGATLGLSILGLNLGLSLYPQTGTARRLLGLALALMAIVSTVLFLMGWVVLVAAILHTARRLPRWQHATEAAAGAA